MKNFDPTDDKDLRIEDFYEIIQHLLSDHDDGQLNAQFAQTSGGIANVAFHPKELRFPTNGVAWIIEETALEIKTL